MVRVSTKPNGAIIPASPLKVKCGDCQGGRYEHHRCEYSVIVGEMSRKLVPAEGAVTFDIETAPRHDLLDIIESFDPATVPHPGEFDPSAVKTGNAKNPAIIAEKIEEARAKHAAAVAGYSARVAEAEAEYKLDAIEKAALCATTGRTIAIGYLVHGSRQVVIDSVEHGGEADLIARFWEVFKQARNFKAILSGFNIGGFDVPFLIRRSWMLGTDWPPECLDRPRYLGPVFHDLAERWALTTRDTIKLDALCRRLGIGEKNGNGAEFARKWEEDRMEAVRYLVNDVHLEYRLGVRMGLPE